jgi:uncharacterized protein YqjF (DUF2071 family)
MDAKMSMRPESGKMLYVSMRTHSGEPPANLHVRYGPTNAPRQSEPGSQAQWLTERYCLYSVDRLGGLWRGEIQHLQWPLQEAEVEIEENSMAEGLGIGLSEPPHLIHFAKQLDVLA